ncbi:BPSS1780 family membrane protein [soil metagenome]
MKTTNAMTGWLWVRQGIAIFKKQPAEMLMLFFAYMFLNMGIGLIPFAGQFLPLLLVPVFAMSFMSACRDIEAGQRVNAQLLMVGFRSPALPNLLKLGVLYILAATLAIAASSLIDDGVFWDFVMNQEPIDPKTLPETGMFWSMMFSGLVYLPAMMAFWYAAPLIAWNNMSLSKAVFYSFFAVKRAGKAFSVYGLAWAGIGVVLPLVVSLIIALIVGSATTLMIILMPFSIVLTVVMYCSFYPTYTDIFAQAEPAVLLPADQADPSK